MKITSGIVTFTLAVFLVVLLFFYYRLLISNFALKSGLQIWVEFAADTDAEKDYLKGAKTFYKIDHSAKHGSVIGFRGNYPIKAWALPDDNKMDVIFVETYNLKMDTFK